MGSVSFLLASFRFGSGRFIQNRPYGTAATFLVTVWVLRHILVDFAENAVRVQKYCDFNQTRPVDLEREQNLHGLGRRRPVADRRGGDGARGAADARARPAGGRRVHVCSEKSDPERLDFIS